MADDGRSDKDRSSHKGGRGGRRRDDRRGGGRRDDHRGGGRRRDDRRGGGRRRDDHRGGGGGRRDDRRGGGGGRRDDRRGGRRDDRRGDRRDDRGRPGRDDMVDLVPTYESVKRATGPDGRPLPREIVVPGQTLSDADVRPGLGAYGHSGEVVAATLGIKNVDGAYASVIPLSGQYIPRVGDVVIGRITDVGPSNWLIEINSPYPAPMHVNEVPWHVEFGETTDFLRAGDTVIVRVVRVTEVGRVQVSMEGPGLRKLSGGQLIDVPHSKVPRIIGTRGSMISLIKKYTACRLVVGQNGRIWIDGEADDILIAMGAIMMIAEQSHMHGLTDKIKEYLKVAKGVDLEAEEEAQRAKEREQRAKEQEPKAEEAPEVGDKAKADRPKRERRDKRGRKRGKPARKENDKEGVGADDEHDDLYDGFDDDQLCADPSGGGDGIVTILAPDGESLMVVEEEDLPPCEPTQDEKKDKEDN